MRKLRRSISRFMGHMYARGRNGVRSLRDIYAPNRNPVRSEPGPQLRGKRKEFCAERGLPLLPWKSLRRYKIARRRAEKSTQHREDWYARNWMPSEEGHVVMPRSILNRITVS